MPLQIRRGTEAERQTLASPLVSGELLWITDDEKLYIGNGTTLAKDLTPVTGFGSQEARDAAASIFTAGTHSGISFSYDGSTAIDATVSIPALLENLNTNGFDISGNGNITVSGTVTASAFRGDYKGSISADDSTILVDAVNGSINLDGTVKSDVIPSTDNLYDLGSNSNRFKDLYISGTVTANTLIADYKGSVFADNSTVLVDAVNVSINLDGTVKGDIIPDLNEIYDIGSASFRFKDLYLSGSSIYLGDAVLSSTGTSVDLPAGSTIDGIPIGITGEGVVEGSNYNINIVGDNSSIIVNSSTNEINADLVVSTNIEAGEISGVSGAAIVHTTALNQADQILITNDIGDNVSTFSIRKNTNAGNFGARMTLFRSTGTSLSPSAVSSTDVLSVISSGGYDGVDFTAGAAITVVTDGTVSAGVVPASIEFGTMNASGVFANRGRFTAAGNFELFQPMFMSRTSVLNDFMILQQFTSSPNDSANITFTRARGTPTVPTVASSNDAIIDLAAAAFDGVTYTGSSTIRMNIDGTVSSGIVPGRIEFWTADSSGSQTKKAQFNKDGVLEVDRITALNSSLTIIGDLTGSVFSDGSTMLVNSTDGSLMYYPTTPADWNGTAPTTVGEALDRIAAWIKLSDGTGA